MIGFICGRYFLYVFSTYVLLMALGILLAQFGWRFPAGAGGFISGFVPAMWAGHKFYRTFQSVPELSMVWKLSSYFTIIHVAFVVIILTLIVIFVPEFQELANTQGGMLTVLISLLLGLILLLITRYSFLFGAKQAEKANA